MSIRIRGARPRRRRTESRPSAGPSVREVCLLGLPRPGPGWAEGDRLEWGGRVYRVAAAPTGPGPIGDGACYLHLAMPEAATCGDRP